MAKDQRFRWDEVKSASLVLPVGFGAYTVGVTPGLGTVIVGMAMWPKVTQKGDAAALLARSALRTLSALQTSLFSRARPFGVAMAPLIRKARRKLSASCGRYMVSSSLSKFFIAISRFGLIDKLKSGGFARPSYMKVSPAHLFRIQDRKTQMIGS